MINRKQIGTAILFLAMTGTMTSCLSSDDDSTGTDTCSITAFTLGNMKRTIYVAQDDGTEKDSVITIGASSYTMTIDDDNYTIQNADSLPYGSKVSAVLVTITYDGYLAGYREANNEDATWNAYSSTDSIDFTKPQEFWVYSTDGTNVAKYTVTLNVHQQRSELFTWNALSPNVDLTRLSNTRLAAKDGTLYIWGEQDGTTRLYTTEDGSNYSGKGVISENDLQFNTLQQKDGIFYVNNSEGDILESSNGITWSATTLGNGYTLVAAGTQSLYAVKDQQLYQLTDSWTAASLDTLGTVLPTQDFAAAVNPLATNNNLERITLIGTQGANNGYAPETWYTVTSNQKVTPTRWNHIPAVSGYQYPDWENIATFAYNDEIIAFGNSSRSGNISEDMAHIYISKDNGITWTASTTYALPSELAGEKGYFAATVDSQNFVWIVKDGRVWKGRLNQLSFNAQ
jgi:hypothetical protein